MKGRLLEEVRLRLRWDLQEAGRPSLKGPSAFRLRAEVRLRLHWDPFREEVRLRPEVAFRLPSRGPFLEEVLRLREGAWVRRLVLHRERRPAVRPARQPGLQE